MQVKIKVEGFDKEEDLVLSTEDLDNLNFVDIHCQGIDVSCPIDKLQAAATMFMVYRDHKDEREIKLSENNN